MVKERPSDRCAQRASGSPPTASAIPAYRNGRWTTSAQAGGSTQPPTIAAITANCATTQRPPRARNSSQRDEAGVVELRVDLPDELRRSGAVDRQRHQCLAALAGARDGHVC